MNDRDHLDRFLSAIDASPTALERPVCRGWIGDYQITGKRGYVLTTQPGYLLYANTRKAMSPTRIIQTESSATAPGASGRTSKPSSPLLGRPKTAMMRAAFTSRDFPPKPSLDRFVTPWASASAAI